MLVSGLDQAIKWFCGHFDRLSFLGLEYNVRAFLAVILVSLICGAVGSLVVGNRMAFFSDALAHCAFAGVALGFLLALGAGVSDPDAFYDWAVPVMVLFGVVVGLLIAWVREKTGLASDTVIGIFFAGAIGFGAILLRLVAHRTARRFDPETFLFGDPLTVTSAEVVWMLLLLLVTLGMLAWLYNELIFTSFSPSLARSRRLRVRLSQYLFVVLLAVIVNLCLKTVGALLINALLIVPAATASNLSRNLRQYFWMTMGLCLFVGIAGHVLSWEVSVATARGGQISFGAGGIMVVLSVVLFALSVLVARLPRFWLQRQARG